MLFADQIAPDADATAAAITEATFQVLLWLYPGLTDSPIPVVTRDEQRCQTSNNVSLREYNYCAFAAIQDVLKDQQKVDKGAEIGRQVAERIKDKYAGDGSQKTEPVWYSDFPSRTISDPKQGFDILQWQIDPVSKLQVALGGRWSDVKPLTMTSSFQFRKPEAESPLRKYSVKDPKDAQKWPSYDALLAYAGEYRLNSSGLSDPASTDPRDGYFVAQLWAYDATAGLCAPGRLYNQVADEVMLGILSDPSKARPGIDINKAVDIARYYALVNIALGDAAIAAWDSKYYYQFPRPVTVIRKVKAGSAVLWYPMGAQLSNSDEGKNITPPFPAYPSGHATFGGALFGILRQFVKEDHTFDFQSDEFNSKNKDAFNYIRCGEPGKNPDGSPDGKYAKFCNPRKFTLDCAERENADSRIFMGVHWIFHADDGIEMGNRVAKHAFTTALKPAGTLTPVNFAAKPGQGRADLICAGVT